tara:strand:- start:207 stop:368 length:162 start_codon:yes stop_codon:yes gene_type:complete
MRSVTFNITFTLSKKNWINETTAAKLADQLAITIKKVAQPVKIAVTWKREKNA